MLPTEGSQHVDTGLLAVPADFRANTAMLVLVRVPLAFLCADPTSLRTALNHRGGHARVELGLPAEDLARGDAHVAAVQAQADAADHRLDIVLGEIGVRAGGARLCAVEASVDARHEQAGLDGGSRRVRLQELPGVSHQDSLAK